MSSLHYIDIDDDIIFFNQGDKICHEFIPRSGRKNFFWFHNEFYSHCSIDAPDRYLHLFVRNPKKCDVLFEAMQGITSFEELREYQQKESESLKDAYRDLDFRRALGYNPPILRSESAISPDIIFDFKSRGSEMAEIVFPFEHDGKEVRLFDDRHVPISFVDIPEIVEIVPNIRHAYPR